VQALHALGLEPSARLVELSLAISLPGASAQEMHTDITPSTPNTPPASHGAAAAGTAPLVTAWLALQVGTRAAHPTSWQCMLAALPLICFSLWQDVTEMMGPTRVLPRSHHRFAKRILRMEAEHAAGDSFAQVTPRLTTAQETLGYVVHKKTKPVRA
jgi:ectoine hydroxylase-related dioxygenase (phytanoyl-CoA dioxygenase family)